MATRKSKTTRKASTKRASAKKVAKKASTKRASAKKVAKKASTKNAKPLAKTLKLDETRKIKATKGQEHHFYKGFPRGEAYAILMKARGQTMVVKTFLDKVEALDKVKDRKQARGIVQKLIGKPGDDGTVGAVCRYV